jgi:hypothetical protein
VATLNSPSTRITAKQGIGIEETNSAIHNFSPVPDQKNPGTAPALLFFFHFDTELTGCRQTGLLALKKS